MDVLVEPAPDGGLLIRSPGVGVYGHTPRVGEILTVGSRVGRLTTLGKTIDLKLPRGSTGRVAERRLANRRDPVEYGQELLRLVPVEAGEATDEGTGSGAGAVEGLPEGTFAVTSFTHGMFYSRPGPDSPSYVKEGQIVEQGNTLGLVEVMKCFSAIAYGGDDRPPRAEVVEIRAEDGAEVQVDQILFVMRPA
jgi:acetyl-CoA carboxylase biotin carboxyl carrier protein